MNSIADTIDPVAEALEAIEEKILEHEERLERLAAQDRDTGFEEEHARVRIDELQRRAAMLRGQFALPLDE